MNRRGFFGRLTALFGLAAATPAAKGNTPLPAAPALAAATRLRGTPDCVHEVQFLAAGCGADGRPLEHTYRFHFPAPVQVLTPDESRRLRGRDAD